jgi:hypothetical protein
MAQRAILRRGQQQPLSASNLSSPRRWGRAALAALTVASTVGITVATVAVDTPVAAAEVTTTFNPSNLCEGYIVPPNVNQIAVSAVGGAGFPGGGPASPGGKGGTASGTFEVESGQVLYVIVATAAGGSGQENLAGGSKSHGGAGGDGMRFYGSPGGWAYSGGGGGSSFVTTDSTHCGSGQVNGSGVLVVAGGGGGGGSVSALGAHGGAGGDAGTGGGNSAQDCFIFCFGGGNGGGAGTTGGPGSHGASHGGNGSSISSAYSTGGSPVGDGEFGGGGGGGWNGGGQGGDNFETFGGGGGGANYVAPAASSASTGVATSGATPSVAITPIATRRLLVGTNGSGTGTVTASQINCGAVASPSCKAFYATGTQVTLTATPTTGSPGSRFAGWNGGGCSGVALQCTVDMTNANYVTATFNDLERLTYDVSGQGGHGGGTITTSPLGFACGAGCVDFDRDSVVTLTGVPDSSSVFQAFDCHGVYGTTCTVTMDRARSAHAYFVENVLTVRTEGAGSGVITSEPAGITCTGSGCIASKFFPWGTVVTLTVSPNAGSSFQWLNYQCINRDGPTCVLHLEGSIGVLGRYTVNARDLTVENIGTGGGGVVSSPAGIDCATHEGCGESTRRFDQFTVVTLTATPESGTAQWDSTFTGWSGACSNTTGPCVVTLDTAKTVRAQFTLIPRYRLQVSPAGNGSGAITSDVGGIACGYLCQQDYYQDTPVTLTATSDSATSHFDGWAGPCTNTSGTCTVTMSQAKNVTATFTLNRHTLTVHTAGDGTGRINDGYGYINCVSSCSTDFDHGSQVILEAHPTVNVPTFFTGWTGPCTNAQPSMYCYVTMDQTQSVTATFTRDIHVLDVTRSGSGTGTVTSDLLGINGQGINCGAVCAGTYNDFEFITLTATPTAANSRFVRWTGACATTANVCSVILADAASVDAEFALNTLTVVKAGAGTGTVTSGDGPQTINCGIDCTDNYPTGTVVTLTANPAIGTSFTGWTGGCINGQPAVTCDVVMATARTITATFKTSPKVTVVLAGTGASQGFVGSGTGQISCGQGNTTCETFLTPGNGITLNSNNPIGNSVSFDGWSGACTGTGACSFTPDDAVVVTATYTLQTNPFTVVKTGTGTGSVVSNPAGAIDCGSTCAHDYPIQSSVQVVATPDANSRFIAWTGACSTASTTCTVSNMTQARTVTAVFDLIPYYTLTVSPTGTGRGHITSDVGGINCPGTCSATFLENTVVTLSQTTDNSVFDGWGAGCDTAAPAGKCGLRMGAARTMTPGFTLNTVFLVMDKRTTLGAGGGTVTSSPAGITCGAVCGASFELGTYVTLTATPDSVSNFSPSLWQSVTCVEGITNANIQGQCTVLADTFHSIIVTFQHKPTSVTLGFAGTGTGSVSGFGSGRTCTFTCIQQYTYNQPATLFLTPSPAPGSQFAGWAAGSPCASPTSNPCVFNISGANMSLTAVFNLIPRVLTVQHGGSGAGAISSAPVDVNCLAGQCQSSFPNGSVVTLTATPDTGTSFFTGWTGSCTNATGACTVTMDAAKSVRANFSLIQRTLTATKAGSGSGTIVSFGSPTNINCGATCAISRVHGQTVTLLATPAPGSVLTGWSPNCNLVAEYCQVTMNGDQTVTATFEETRTLSVAKDGSGSGSITSSPNVIDCGGTCGAEVVLNRTVTLTATPDAASSVFSGWTGDCTNASGDCTVTMDQARSVTATFTLIDRSLQVAIDGTGTGSVTSSPGGIDCGATCSADFPHGTVVNLNPQPADALSYFAGWAGDCSGTGACDVAMDGSKSVTATFSPVQAVPPTNLAANAPNPTLVNLSWDPVPGATGYVVFRSETTGGPYTEVATVGTNAWDDGGVAGTTTYFYVVRADTPAGVSVDSTEATVTTPTPPNPLTLSGTVTDPSGTPVAGIDVTVLDWYYGTVVATTTTDGSGTYSVVLAHTQRVKVQFDDPTGTWARRFNDNRTTFGDAPDINVDGSGPVTADVSLVTYLGSLQGVVTDINGTPLAGITVTVKNPVFGNTLATRTTDGSGTYAVAGLDPYAVTVKFVDPTATFAPVKQAVTIESGPATIVDAQMVTGGTVSGTVTADGTGRAGIAVLVLTATAPVEILGLAYTGADGTYAIPNIPPGDHKVLFADPGVFATPRTGLVPVFYGGSDALTYGLNDAYDSAPTIHVLSGETYTADQAMAPIVSIDVGSSVTVAAGESTFIFATVTGFDVSGTVTFTLNGVETTVPLSGSFAWFETPTDLPAGTYEITIRYDGDASNEPAWAAPVTLIVT